MHSMRRARSLVAARSWVRSPAGTNDLARRIECIQPPRPTVAEPQPKEHDRGKHKGEKKHGKKHGKEHD